MNQLEEKLSIVETTSSNLDELKNIKNKLFNKNLISCAKIFGPIDVSYKWDGKIIDDKEFLLRLLSKTSFFQEIKEIIKKTTVMMFRRLYLLKLIIVQLIIKNGR